MSGLDVEALLESTAASLNEASERDHDDRSKVDSNERRDRDRSRDRERRRKGRSRDRDAKDEDLKSPRSEHGSANGSHRSKRRSRSRDSDRRRRRDRYGDDRSGGDYYRGGGRARSRSRSPYDERYYRPNGRTRRDDREEDRPSRRDREGRKRSRSRGRRSHTPEEELNEDERDKRTVFVQQLAARLRTKELIAFFEKVGPVKEAQIVKDRVSGRSKGSVYSFILFLSICIVKTVLTGI
jgi:RNA-binding protein 23/39